MGGAVTIRLQRASMTGRALMRGFISAVIILAALHSPAWASAPGTLSSLRVIHNLTNDQANTGMPVSFKATVTYFRSYENALFVQNSDGAIYVETPSGILLTPGDQVEIEGKTQASFRPIVIAKSITVLRHGVRPQPEAASFDELIRSQFDCRLVTVHAVVRNADTVISSSVRSAFLQLHLDGGEIGAVVDVDNSDVLHDLLDAEVEVTGTVSGRFDGKMQQTGILLHVTSLEGVKVLKYAGTHPWTLPLTPMDSILSAYHVSNLSRRIRVRGTLTYFQPGSMAVLQDGTKSLWVMTSSIEPLHIGDQADATGFPDVHDGFLALTGAEILDSGKLAPIQPQQATWDQLSTSRNLFDLVSIEGEVVAEVRGATQDEYVLAADDNLFSAIYRHPASDNPDADPLPSMKHVAPGSKVRVTGVCFMNGSNNFDARVPFNILLRSPKDLVVIAGAPWWTVGNLFNLVGVLAVLVLAVSVWVWALRRRVRQQTAAITAQIELEAAQERRAVQLEQRRSRILEDINSSRPLAEIIEHISEMVSFMLSDSSCWCEISDGSRLGNPPEKRVGLRIVGKEIPARTGGALGMLYVALRTREADTEAESTALLTGARLAALAIETRKLYSDLVYRSEFDLLTDVYNRFSLERYLEEQIGKAQEKSSFFGLIYVDLDEFKQVNDLYGHHVGDLYLQEVSARMRRQLRNGDMLARLGGDEFAALVSVARSHAEVDEIAQRLEHCFDAPFAVEGYLLRGSASMGIALYPVDGTTAESLLKAADIAMYATKESKRVAGGMPSQHDTPRLPFRD
jgi:diguanylate cyclase (GGDEF)-like protein